VNYNILQKNAKKCVRLFSRNASRSRCVHIYAITGDSLDPVNDAVRRDGRL
jgi:hypothetical protein